MPPVGTLLVRHLADPTSSWRVGELGVLAEFHHLGPARMADPYTVITGCGAIRVQQRDDVLPLAYETPSANPRLWNHGVVFCLPAAAAGMSWRTEVTELGADNNAILPQARSDIVLYPAHREAPAGVCASRRGTGGRDRNGPVGLRHLFDPHGPLLKPARHLERLRVCCASAPQFPSYRMA